MHKVDKVFINSGFRKCDFHNSVKTGMCKVWTRNAIEERKEEQFFENMCDATKMKMW